MHVIPMAELSDDLIKGLIRVPGVGEKIARRIAYEKNIHTLDELLKLSKEDLMEVEGIGENRAKTILETLGELIGGGEVEDSEVVQRGEDHLVKHFIETRRWREKGDTLQDHASVNISLSTRADNIVRQFILTRRERREKYTDIRKKDIEIPSSSENDLPSKGSSSLRKRGEEGFTNGVLNKRKRAVPKSDKGMINGFRNSETEEGRGLITKRNITAYFVLLLLIGGIVASLYLILPQDEVGINIDGNFEDWDRFMAYHAYPPPSDELPPHLRIDEYRLHSENGFLYVYLRTDGPLFESEDGVYSVHVFVDTHQGKGYQIGDINGEYRLEVYGWNGSIKGTSYYAFREEHASNDWNGYVHKGSLRAEHVENELELKVWLPVNNSIGPGVVIHTKCCRHHYATAGNVRPGESSLVSWVNKAGPGVVDPGAEFDIIRLTTVSLSGVSTLDHVTLEYNRHSTPNVEFVSLYNGNEGNYLVDWTPFESGMTLHPDEEVGEDILELTVRAITFRNTPPGSVVGLKIADVGAGKGTASLLPANLDNIYVSEIPDEIAVNGAFVHWLTGDIREDDFDDLTPADAWNPNIDIRKYSWAENHDTVFMVGVEGNMLGGTVVPYNRGRPPELVDSDGDGIPDIYDPFPNDFTNDGTPDSEMLTPDGLPDVDGDGVADWPHGPDMWLNTTIPVHPDIPEEYWGREVSRYIGPVELPVRTGEDTIRIFIDADGDPSTGYTAPWMDIGAEYMVMINGCNMEVTHTELLRYNGRTYGRTWDSLGEVPVALNETSLETAVDIELSQDFQVAFVATDWRNNMDTAHLRNTYDTRTRASTQRYRFYLREEDKLLSENGTQELVVNLRNRDGEREHTWSSEPFAGDFELSETVSVHLHLTPTTIGDKRPGLNVTLYHEDGVIGTGEQPPTGSPGWYTIMVDPGGASIPPGNSLYIETTITGDPDTHTLEMDIRYNSGEYDSRLGIPTFSVIDVDEITTHDGDGNPGTVFGPGDLVEVRAKVTHPVSAEFITKVVMNVTYPDGTVMIEDVNMTMADMDPDSPPYWSNRTSSFYLEEETPGGRYVVRVTASDVQKTESAKTSSFIVPMDPGVSVYPDGEKTVTGGTEAVYGIEVRNIGNVPDEYILSPGASSRLWTTELRYDGNTIAIDDNGDGIWNWVDPLWDSSGNPGIVLAPQEYMEFEVAKPTPEGSRGETDHTRLYALSVNHSISRDSAEFITRTPVPMVTKTLYLHAGDTMNTTVGDSETEVYTIQEYGHNRWYLEPPLAGDFALHDNAYVHLYLEPYYTGHTGPDVTVELSYDGESISGHTQTVDQEGWYEFTLLTDVVIPVENRLEVTVSVNEVGSVDLSYDSQEYPSRLEVKTDTYVNVENITCYKNGNITEEFRAGDDMSLEALVVDPLGSYDITGADLTVTDPHGNVLIDGEEMVLSDTDPGTPSYWNLYIYEFTLPANAPAGIYHMVVKGLESNGVTSNGYDYFRLLSGVLIEPDNQGVGEPGTVVSYIHTVQNTGNGTDVFNFIVYSSRGYNVSLYTSHGILMGTDTGGNGVWDYINEDWDTNGNGKPDTGILHIDEIKEVYIEIEIPGGAASGNESTEIKVASHAFAHIHDSALDTTTIAEFPSILQLVISVITFMFVLFKVKDPSR